tara:strand:+ start:193 stop:804 length:612 start_codon:yes stop_codon:yes gene_type:complete
VDTSELYTPDYVKAYIEYDRNPKGLVLSQARQTALNFVDAGKLLDIGCGAGSFMDIMRASGWAVEGVDINSAAVTYCESKNHVCSEVDVDKASWPSSEGDYNAITLFDLVEHVSDPQYLLYRISKILAPGGVVVISTPRIPADGFGEWKHLKWDEHVSYFDEVSLSKMLASLGYQLVRMCYLEDHVRGRIHKRPNILTAIAEI